jgi:hypothetical protein
MASKTKSLLITIGLLSAGAYFGLADRYNDTNPLHLFHRTNQDVNKTEVKRDKLSQLEDMAKNLYAKASAYDNRPGLSFADQAELIHQLGSKHEFIEGRDYVQLALDIHERPSGPLLLLCFQRIGENYTSGEMRADNETIDETVARAYLQK